MEAGETTRRCRVVAIPDALATAGLEYPLVGSEWWRVVSVSFTLTADANVAARRPVVRLLDSTAAALVAVSAPFTLSAGLAARFTFAAGLLPFGANDAANIGGPFLGAWLPPNITLEVAVGAAAAADALADVRLVVEIADYLTSR